MQAYQARLGSGPDDQNDQKSGEDLGQRAGQRRETLGSDDPFPVPLGLSVKPGAFPFLFTIRPDQPDGAQPLGDGGGDLSPFPGPSLGVASEPAQQYLQPENQQRNKREREKGKPDRNLAQDEQCGYHHYHILK